MTDKLRRPTAVEGLQISRLCYGALKALAHKLAEHNLDKCCDTKLLIGSLAVECTDSVDEAFELLAVSLRAMGQVMGYDCHICMIKHEQQQPNKQPPIKAKA